LFLDKVLPISPIKVREKEVFQAIHVKIIPIDHIVQMQTLEEDKVAGDFKYNQTKNKE
jgi:hypothetical protein